MKYALVENDQRIEALPKRRAVCPICNTVVIAKCGTRRMHHWAHEGLKNCDPWKEAETQWHREWKNKFPREWQEFVQHDDAGEKHVADVRTAHGPVLEFQHSHIDPSECDARERFHKKVWWVVDGTRLKRDYPRFQRSFRSFMRTKKADCFLVPSPGECLPTPWLNRPVSVFLDFLGVESTNTPDQLRNILWEVLPGLKEGKVAINAISRTQFVETLLNVPPASLLSFVRAVPQAPTPLI